MANSLRTRTKEKGRDGDLKVNLYADEGRRGEMLYIQTIDLDKI